MISVCALSKTYHSPAAVSDLLRLRLRGRPVPALHHIDLDIEPNEIVGVMGENGAGKTTLLRILAGLTTPTSGSATVAGLDAARGGAALRAQVGYAFADERSFAHGLSARENLAFFAALHGHARPAALARADALLDEVGLAPSARRPFRELSTGMRQRAALARALLGSPSVLLLDEPTRGVDPAGRAALRALVARSTHARTVLLATHDLAEAAALCSRVLVLHEGRVRALVPPAELPSVLPDA